MIKEYELFEDCYLVCEHLSTKSLDGWNRWPCIENLFFRTTQESNVCLWRQETKKFFSVSQLFQAIIIYPWSFLLKTQQINFCNTKKKHSEKLIRFTHEFTNGHGSKKLGQKSWLDRITYVMSGCVQDQHWYIEWTKFANTIHIFVHTSGWSFCLYGALNLIICCKIMHKQFFVHLLFRFGIYLDHICRCIISYALSLGCPDGLYSIVSLHLHSKTDPPTHHITSSFFVAVFALLWGSSNERHFSFPLLQKRC